MIAIARSPAKVECMKKTPAETLAQQNRVAQLENAVAQLLAVVSQRGYYGTAGISVTVQDGRIQHVRVSTERTLR